MCARSLPIFAFLALLLCSTATLQAADNDEVWLLIDTPSLSLSVMRGDRPLEIFHNISIGRNGTSLHKRHGDDTTPLGDYRIDRINPTSRFRKFYRINYPSSEDAKRAFKAGLIDLATFRQLIQAVIFERPPPQNTILGGYIGIHGLGSADPDIHQQLNWTHGCVALTNEQIDRLDRWIKIGMRVLLR